jgi:MoaA/NifB/PqqE/SkfB family radical SAM enzyme
MFELAEEAGADHVIFEIVFAFVPETLLTGEELARTEQLLAACAGQARVSSNAVEIVELLRREQRECASAKPASSPPSPPAAPHSNGSGRPPERAAEPVAPPPKPAVYRPANRCSVGFDSSFVTALGDVLPCCFSTEKMGNVKEQSFREIWHGKKYAGFRKRLINGRFPEYCSRFRCKLTSFLHD